MKILDEMLLRKQSEETAIARGPQFAYVELVLEPPIL